MDYFALLPSELLLNIFSRINLVDFLSVFTAYPYLFNNKGIIVQANNRALLVTNSSDIIRTRNNADNCTHELLSLITTISISENVAQTLVTQLPYFLTTCKNLGKVTIQGRNEIASIFLNNMHKYNRQILSPLLDIISYGVEEDDDTFFIYRPIPSAQHQLTFLHTSITHFTSYDAFFDFIEQFPLLTTLALQKAPPLPKYLQQFHQRCENLTTLRVLCYDMEDYDYLIPETIDDVNRQLQLTVFECGIANFTEQLYKCLKECFAVRSIIFDGTYANSQDYDRLYDILNTNERLLSNHIRFVNTPMIDSMFDLVSRKYGRLFSLSFINTTYEIDRHCVILDLAKIYVYDLVLDLTFLTQTLKSERIYVQIIYDGSSVFYGRETDLSDLFCRVDYVENDKNCTSITLQIKNTGHLRRIKLIDSHGLNQFLYCMVDNLTM